MEILRYPEQNIAAMGNSVWGYDLIGIKVAEGINAKVLDIIGFAVGLESSVSLSFPLKAFKLPIDLYIPRINQIGFEMSTIISIEGDEFSFDDGRKMKLTDFDNLEATGLLSKSNLGLIYYLYLIYNFEKDLNSNKEVERSNFRQRLHLSLFQFGISDVFWRSSEDGEKNAIEEFLLNISSLPSLVKRFMNAEDIKGRIVVSPFATKTSNLVRNDEEAVIGIAEIVNGEHFCNDAIVYDVDTLDNGFVFDGVSISSGVIGFMEEFTALFAKNLKSDSEGYRYQLFSAALGVNPYFQEGKCTMASYRINRGDRRTVSFETVGDAYAIHFDSRGRIKAVIGGRGDRFDFYNRKTRITVHEQIEYLNNSNTINDFLSPCLKNAKIKNSESAYEDGDFILIGTDCIEKFTRHISFSYDPNKKFQNPTHDYFKDLESIVVTNVDQAGAVNGFSLIFLLELVEKIAREHNNVDYYAIYAELLEKYFRCEQDDFAFILRRITDKQQ